MAAKKNTAKGKKPKAKKSDVPVFMQDAETFLYLKYGPNGKWARLLTWVMRMALSKGKKKKCGVCIHLPYNGKMAEDLLAEAKILNDFMKARPLGFGVDCGFLSKNGKQYIEMYLKVLGEDVMVDRIRYSDAIRTTSPINYWEEYGVEG